MKILHRFMLKQFLGPFIVAFIVVDFTMLMQTLWVYIDDLVGKGLELSIIAKLFFYIYVQWSVMAFPLAVLLAAIFTLGNMSENYELIALKAAGISLQRILFPLIILSFIIANGAFLFANNVIPVVVLQAKSLLFDISRQRPELQIQEGIFYSGIDGYVIRIGRRDYKTNMLYGMRIYNHTENIGNAQVILADSGKMAMSADKSFLEMTLYSGRSYKDEIESKRPVRENKNYPFSYQFFDEQIFRVALSGLDLTRSDLQIFKSNAPMKNLSQLATDIDSLSKTGSVQVEQLRGILQPVYRNPELTGMRVDTTLRAKVPDNFRMAFNKQPRSKKQPTVQDAVNQVRSQKDQVAGLIYELEDINLKTRKHQIEWHRKFTMSLACFIFFFIGAPLGAIIRKGGLGTPIIIAVLFFVLYYVIFMIGEKSAKQSAMTPLVGMWLATFVIFPIGVFLTWMATRDSSIFNQELYVSYIRKGLNFIFVTHRIPRPEIAYTATLTDLAPENMIAKLEELSLLCKLYLEGDFKKYMKFNQIWHKQEDDALVKIASRYDHTRMIIKQADVEMIRETVAEYPSATFQNYKIKKIFNGQVVASAVIFPVWVYLYLKAWIQKFTLRNDLQQIISANRNLVNELKSIL